MSIYPLLTFSSPLNARSVFDVSSKQSFEGLSRWQKELKSLPGEPVQLLVGNKVDQPRAVPRAVAEDWAREHGILFLEASARSGQGVMSLVSRAVELALAAGDVQQWRACLLDLSQPVGTRTRAAFRLRSNGR